MEQFLYYEYFSNTVLKYLVFLISLIISCLVLKIIGYFLTKHVMVRAKKTKSLFDDLLVNGITKYLMPILYLTAIYLNSTIIYLNPTLTKIINTVLLAFITIIGTMFVSSVIVFLFNKSLENKLENSNNKHALKWINGIARVLIWGIAIILYLDNIGFKMNSLITGLGIGGIAIAFAAQAILADVFCYITIFFDRPFEVGDFIIAGENMGTVEHIGVKTTRLRSLNGEQLIFSNIDLTGSHISNYKTMEQRRVIFTIGVTYNTELNKLKGIPNLIKSIVDNVPDTTFGRTHFYSYGTYSLNFEIAYYVLSGDYDKYMDINQEINFMIKDEFDKNGIEFAFPTQTLELHNSSVRLTQEGEKI